MYVIDSNHSVSVVSENGISDTFQTGFAMTLYSGVVMPVIQKKKHSRSIQF